MIADGGPSMTARRVSAHRLGFTRLPWPSGDAAAEEALAADVAGGIEVPQSRMHEYLRARTAFFDRFVVSGLGAGTRQVVVGGAGYDGRSLRYAAPGVRWFELDHPATQRDKLARLDRLGIEAGHVRFVPADFTAGPVGPLLLDAGLDAGLPALFLLEGVAVYLPASVVEDVLSQFRDVAGNDSMLAISMPVTSMARPGSRFSASVASLGEPALSRFEPAEAEALLNRCGWSLVLPAGDEDPVRWERRRGAGLMIARTGPRIGTEPDRSVITARSGEAALITARSGPPPDPGPAQELITARSGHPQRLALPELLSQALVAFTIETDNEAEHILAHRTSDYGDSARGRGPWLTSLVMYENCLRFLDQPRTVAELRHLARTGTNLDGVRRWGYVTISGAGRTVAGRLKRPGKDAVLTATPGGRLAREVRAPLPGVIEERWRERYGAERIASLRDALTVIAGQLDPGLPDCLPILHNGLFSRLLDASELAGPAAPGRDPLPLNALLSRPLLAFAVEFERESALSLAISANVLRVLTTDGVRMRDVPVLGGISAEAVAMAMRILTGERLAETGKDTDGRSKIVRLTAAGAAAKHAYRDHFAGCERRWRDRLDAAAAGVVADVLTALATPASQDSDPPLFAAIAPYPDGWRARVRPPDTLPRYPAVLHRGGYPDGS